MGGRSKAPGPSYEETAALQATRELNERQLALLDEQKKETEAARAAAEADKMKTADAAQREEQRRRRGTTGTRTLLTGDWAGFQRGGDMGAR